MDKSEIMKCNDKYFMNVFSGRYPLAVDHGKGLKVYDKNGDEYLDFMAGIGVNALGHSYPELVSALKDQIEKVIHCSNLYYIEPQAKLEKLLIENSCADKLFFTNSGAEANEGALKLVRKYFKQKGENRFQIITARDSFHGRTLATIAATGQTKYQKPFTPLPDGFNSVPYNDIKAIKEAMGPETAGIMLEPIQGEGGVYPAKESYLKDLRKLCDQKGILLIFDEIQCGMGRSGTLFAYEQYGVKPDILTVAKALGGGVPIGAFLAKKEVADAFEPGDHGSTFGGNHLATTAAYTTLKIILEDNILDNVRQMGAYFQNKLNEFKSEFDSIIEIRGKGLMIGLQFDDSVDAGELVNSMFEKGFLINAVQEHALRFLPPLIVSEKEIDALIKALKEVLR